MSKVIAIVPARGGSKGLPNKNILSFNGKPLIWYTIQAALKSDIISDVIVSTDSQEIADIAIEAGAICPFLRPQEFATDTSPAIDTYIYTLHRLEVEFGYNIDSFFVLQPTSPLRSASDIDEAYQLFANNNADSVVSYTENDKPIQWLKLIDDNFNIKPLVQENDLLNRQEYKKTFYPNGAIYLFKKELILTRSYYTSQSFAYIMPKSRSVDIDTAFDFQYAEFLMLKNHE